MSFDDWQDRRLNGWTRIESFVSKMGEVYHLGNEEWRCKVIVGGRLVAVNGTFDSAAVAMGVVERTYKREMGKNAAQT